MSKALIEAQKRAEDEQASQQSLKAIQRAFREALLALPREEYDWFDVQARARARGNGDNAMSSRARPDGTEGRILDRGVAEARPNESPQRQFFDYAGPLFSVVVSPAASTVPLNEKRRFRALPRDRSRRRVAKICSSPGTSSRARGRSKASPIRKSSSCAPRFQALCACA